MCAKWSRAECSACTPQQGSQTDQRTVPSHFVIEMVSVGRAAVGMIGSKNWTPSDSTNVLCRAARPVSTCGVLLASQTSPVLVTNIIINHRLITSHGATKYRLNLSNTIKMNADADPISET
jgi:hypothetical protein